MQPVVEAVFFIPTYSIFQNFNVTALYGKNEIASFLKMGKTRSLFVYFRSFHNTNLTINEIKV